MRTIQLTVDLPRDDVHFLADLAEAKRCTLQEMIEEAVAVFAGTERRMRDCSVECFDSPTGH